MTKPLTRQQTKGNIGDWMRIALTVALLYAVYGETGWATTLCLALIAARAEILDYNAGRTFTRSAR